MLIAEHALMLRKEDFTWQNASQVKREGRSCQNFADLVKKI